MVTVDGVSKELVIQARGHAGREKLGMVLLALFIAALHTRLSIPGIPFLMNIAVATVILTFYFDRVPLDVVRFCVAIWGIAFLSLFMAPQPFSDMATRLPSFAYLGASLYTAGAAFLLIRELPRRSVASVVLICLVIILVGIALEQMLPPVRDLTAKYAAYIRPSNPYDTYTRDSQMTVWINVPRPTFFTPEPSDVAKTISLLTLLWYIYSESKTKLIAAAGILFYAILAVRSPSMILGVGGLTALVVSQYLASLRGNRQAFLTVAFQLGLMVIGFLAVLGFMIFLYQNRIQTALSGADSSTLVRFVVPSFLSYEVMLTRPLFGYGVGARNTLGTLMYNVLVSFHVAALSKMINTDSIGASMGNAFCEMLITTGAIGSFAITACLHKMRACFSTVPWLFYFPTLFVFWFLAAGFSTVVPWTIAFLLLAPSREMQSAPPSPTRAQALST